MGQLKFIGMSFILTLRILDVYCEDAGQIPLGLPLKSEERRLDSNDELKSSKDQGDKTTVLDQMLERDKENNHEKKTSSHILKYKEEQFSESEKNLNKQIQKNKKSLYNQSLPSEIPSEEQLKFISKREHIRSFEKLGDKKFSFYFLLDDYSYKDNQSSFTPTFEDSPGSHKGGFFLLSQNWYLFKGFISSTLGFTSGFGLNYGQGRFSEEDGSVSSSSELSDTKIRLWTFPLDLALGIQFNLGRFVTLGASAGPSGVLMWQNRSDLTDSHPKKNYRLFGYGYAYQGDIQVSLNQFLGMDTVYSYEMSGITQYFLGLFFRGQNYDNFPQEDLKISGVSFGAGLSIEYL